MIYTTSRRSIEDAIPHNTFPYLHAYNNSTSIRLSYVVTVRSLLKRGGRLTVRVSNVGHRGYEYLDTPSERGWVNGNIS